MATLVLRTSKGSPLTFTEVDNNFTNLNDDITTIVSGATLTNAAIAANAGIADTKLATISTAGKVSNSATTAASGNVLSAIVARDGSGNFTAGTITANLTGNVTGNLTGTASAIADNTVTSAKIVDGSIVNADVNASAAIAGTKISPDFGAQNVVTTGASTAARFIPTGSTVPANGLYLPSANTVGVATNGTGRLFVDSTGRLLVGTSTVITGVTGYNDGTLQVSNSTSGQGGAAGLVAFAWDDGTGPNDASIIQLNKSLSPTRGTHVIVGNGNTLGSLVFGGSDGTKFEQAARIEAQVDGTPGANDMPGRLVFSTTADNASSPTERMRIDSSGNVGIGTTSPGRLFTVANATNTDATVKDVAYFCGSYASNTGSGARILIGGDIASITNRGVALVGVNSGGVGNAHDMVFEVSGTGAAPSERARIDSSGRLLVGTSSAFPVRISTTAITPQQQLAGTTGTASTFVQGCASTTDTTAAFQWFAKFASGTINDNTTTVNADELLGTITWSGSDGGNQTQAGHIRCEVDGTPGANDMPGRLVFSTTPSGSSSPTERMRITNAGAVGIGGTPTAGASLHTFGLLRANSSATLQTSTTGIISSSTATSNTGNVAVETTTTSTSARHHISFVNPNGVVGSVSTSASATAYNTSSDYRLKENVVDLDGAIDRLKQLHVHRFNFIADPDTVVDGFIAHEAAEVVPECVTGTKDEVDDEGNPVYQGIDQSKLVPLLTAALQEAVAKIESLEARLTAAGI